MYKVYLVLGAESSGTRIMTQLLMSCGCFGDDGHVQRLDKYIKKRRMHLSYPVVWRRSFPHGEKWYTVNELIDPFIDKGVVTKKEIFAVVMMRNWLCSTRSAVQAGHVQNLFLAEKEVQESYKRIFAGLVLTSTKYHVVSYDALVYSTQFYLPYIIESLGFSHNIGDRIRLAKRIINPNWKHMKEYFDGQIEKEKNET